MSLLGRLSVYRDQGGVNSGLDQTLGELAGGVEVKPTSFSWVRVECRHDLSSRGDAFLGRRGQATRRSMGTLALAIGVGF